MKRRANPPFTGRADRSGWMRPWRRGAVRDEGVRDDAIRDDAERLLSGQPTAADHQRLAELLTAAKAPGRPLELQGYEAARAVFDQVRVESADDRATDRRGARHGSATPRSGTRLAPGVRWTTVRVAVVGGLLAVTGAAAAAEAGALPVPVQKVAHTLFGGVGVPAPARPEGTATGHPTTDASGHGVGSPGGPRPSGASSGTDPASGSASGSAPGSASDRTSPTSATLETLCQAYVLDANGNGKSHGVTATERKELALAAGGEKDIDAYCGRLLAAATASTAPAAGTAPASASATPTDGTAKTHPTPPANQDKTPGNGHNHTPTPKATR